MRRGFTLMELVLVLAIIIIAMGIGIPVIQSMLDDARITAASDMIRAKTAETRAAAMESGKPWKLACIPNTGVFQMAPDDSTDWEGMEQTPTESIDLWRDKLPKDIIFGANPGDIAGAGSQPSAGTEWRVIAVYLYDGTARDDSITYFGKAGEPPLGMDLRGLTGSVTMRSPAEVKATQP